MKSSVIAGLLVLTLSSGLRAQEADQNLVRALDACIRQAAAVGGPAATAERCVGTIGQPTGDTTLEIANWIHAEYQAWDYLLNFWWGPMRDRAKANGTWEALLASQRQWIATKEATCAAEYEAHIGGTIRMIVGAECFRRFTSDKAIEFYYALAR